MAEFAKAVEKTLRFEGGYNNDPDDRGGETKYGISKKTFPDVDIKGLTIPKAKAIYKRVYWDKLKLDGMKNQAVAEELFDTAVNASCKTACQILQTALNLLVADYTLIVDGVLGSVTLRAVNEYSNEKALLKTLNGLQFMHYVEIVQGNPSQEKWFKGWLKRV